MGVHAEDRHLLFDRASPHSNIAVLLTLIVIPAIYGLIKQANLNTVNREVEAVVA